jgi:uroporphyrinogen-III decarboxylase
MSYEDGWAALNLQMPQRIPRTEYSADFHWGLLQAVTGIEVGVESSPEIRSRASTEFMRAWNYDFIWSTLISDGELGTYYTDMGHAEYMDGAEDWREAKESYFKTPEDVLAFDPLEKLGQPDKATLIQRFEAHYKVNCEKHPFCVNMSGIYITLMSGLIALLGWDMLLLAAGTDQEAFGQFTNRYATWIQHYYDALAEADVPVVMMHDDMVWSSGAFIRPAWYRKYIFPNYKKLIAPLRESGKKVIYTSDGDFTAFVDDLAQAGVHGFVLEPWTDLETVVNKYGQSHVIIGNVDTRILLSGTRDQIRAEVERCINLGRDCPGFFLAVGNHIPPNTPVENALYYNEVYEELMLR